ncbi:LuxR C-terminal-related transcriptional regulator [Longispora albida]|uniref:LuxR C-terminal-related transcriptional regulator n=1 Tax=Longispora albida TaxID=203523 RepID=UPI000361212A|nr:LuxR C-terminal-related transcriptional regulator [Longispora albida]
MTDPIPVLTRHGLSPDADLVYRTLVHSGPAAEQDLSRLLGLHSSRVRPAVEALGAHDLAVVVAAIQGPLWAARPHRPVLRHLTSRPASPLPPAAGGVAAPPGGVLDQARAEILLMCDVVTTGLPDVERRVPGLLGAWGRGVAVRGISLAGGEFAPPAADAEILAGHRRTRQLPGTLMVVDRRFAAFVMAGRQVPVTDPVLVEALQALFEWHWTDAEPDVRLTDRQQAIVAMLVAGHTDEGVARRLDLSRRTIAAEVRTLMDRYRATGRLQLGHILARDFRAD